MEQSQKNDRPGIIKRTNEYWVDPASLVIEEGWNARFDMGDISDLANQIKAQKASDGFGLINKLRVQRSSDPTKFIVRDGERRTRAIQMLLKQGETWEHGIPVYIEPKDADPVDLVVKMMGANEGKRFLPLEEAHGFKKLRDLGLTMEQICARTGRAHMHVRSSLALLDADESLQEAVKKGDITMTAAKEIATVAGGNKIRQRELTHKAAEAKTPVQRRALKDELHKDRKVKAAKKGKVLKMRALSDEQLAELGAAALHELNLALVGAGQVRVATQGELETLHSSFKPADNGEIVAFHMGVLMALKAAAGQDIKLEI